MLENTNGGRVMQQYININIAVPEEILLSLRENNEDFAMNMKKWSALKLFEKQKLSIGQSAELAEMTKEDFIKFAGQNKVSIYGEFEDIIEDLKNA